LPPEPSLFPCLSMDLLKIALLPLLVITPVVGDLDLLNGLINLAVDH